MSDTSEIVIDALGRLAALGVTGASVWAGLKQIGHLIADREARREKAKEDAIADAVKAKDEAYRAVIAGKDAVIEAQVREIGRLAVEAAEVRKENRALNDAAVQGGQKNFERMLTTVEGFRDEIHAVLEQKGIG